MRREAEDPLWNHKEIHIPPDILVPLVDPEEAPTISLPQLRDPLLRTVATLEDLGQAAEKMARQTLFQTRAPFRKGSHHEPRLSKKEEVRLPKNARQFLKTDLATDEDEGLHTRAAFVELNTHDNKNSESINQDLSISILSDSDETSQQLSPQQIRMDRSLMDMIIAEDTDWLANQRALIMPPQSPTSMLKEIPDFDDYSEDSMP